MSLAAFVVLTLLALVGAFHLAGHTYDQVSRWWRAEEAKHLRRREDTTVRQMPLAQGGIVRAGRGLMFELDPGEEIIPLHQIRWRP